MNDYDSAYRLWKNTPGVGMRSIDDSREGIEQLVLRNPHTNFVAEEDGVIIGTALSGHDGRRGCLYHICVAENHRRRGIAGQLVQEIEKGMKAEKINVLYLFCLADNKAGNSFWDSVGWTKQDNVNCYKLNINPDDV